MKKTYLRPEIEITNVQSVGFLAQSFSEDGGTGTADLNNDTATGSALSPDFNFWSHNDAW